MCALLRFKRLASSQAAAWLSTGGSTVGWRSLIYSGDSTWPLIRIAITHNGPPLRAVKFFQSSFPLAFRDAQRRARVNNIYISLLTHPRRGKKWLAQLLFFNGSVNLSFERGACEWWARERDGDKPGKCWFVAPFRPGHENIFFRPRSRCDFLITRRGATDALCKLLCLPRKCETLKERG